MKIDPKMRRIQQKYRKIIEQKNQKKRHFVEAVLVIFFIILFIQLNEYFAFQTIFHNYRDNSVREIDAYESRWMGVTRQIDDTLKNTGDEYIGIAIDFNPKPIKYILKTSFHETNLKVNENLNDLITVTNEIIKSNHLPTLLKENETYEIIVTGKNKDELARKVFHK